MPDDEERAGELDEERRAELAAQITAQVAADLWRTIDRRMRALEGPGWHGGHDPELCQVREGPEQGRLFWEVGERHLLVDKYVVEATPTRRRVIGPEGVIAEYELVRPELN